MDPNQSTAITAKTLREALKFFLEDDHHIDRLEADALQDLILRDGKVDAAEKQFLQEAIATCNFDERALNTLKHLLEDQLRR